MENSIDVWVALLEPVLCDAVSAAEHFYDDGLTAASGGSS
jgi:hypothetical protein